MKNVFYFFILTAVFAFSDRDGFYNPSAYFPVLMEREQLEKSVKFREPQEIINPGKIYYKDGYIFMNEQYKGIHVIDNSDPYAPKNVGFINIPGNVDIAINNNNLYVDNAVDLVTIDIVNFPELKLTSRIRNAFPESTPPDFFEIPYIFNSQNRPEKTIIVGWEKKE